jgi:hypothetical protein
MNAVERLEARRAYSRLYNRRQRALTRVLLARSSWWTIPEFRELRRATWQLVRGERVWVIRTLAERAGVAVDVLATELRDAFLAQTSERRRLLGGPRRRGIL